MGPSEGSWKQGRCVLQKLEPQRTLSEMKRSILASLFFLSALTLQQCLPMAKQREAGLENTAGINLCVIRAAQEKARRRSESKQAEDQPSSWEVCAL